MPKFTSYHMHGGQLFYAKTGKIVPEKVQAKLTVDVAKGTVYRNGRKAGQLKQRTVSKKSKSLIAKKSITRPRVKKVYSKLYVKPPRVKGEPASQAEKIRRISNENYSKAINELIFLKKLTYPEGIKCVNDYVKGNDVFRSEAWNHLHQ